jgi:excisionase family DNA binding protein
VNILTPKIMVSIREASDHTGLSYYAVRKLCLSGKITFVKSGVKYYINLPKLLEYLDAGQEEPSHLSV